MVLKKSDPPKLYYSIKEVAEMIGVSESTLRYWETEFPTLKPKTVASTKVRQYTDKDIELLKVIHNLVKVRGFRISAARKYLYQNPGASDRSADVLHTLIDVREQLKELKRHLDSLV